MTKGETLFTDSGDSHPLWLRRAVVGDRPMTRMRHTYVLDVQWDRPGLPRLVGPFDDPDEGFRWGELNIANGIWEIRVLVQPYRYTPVQEDQCNS